MSSPGALTILDAVLDGDSEDRERMLDDLCGDDDALRADVESLLVFETRAEGFIKSPLHSPIFEPSRLESGYRLGAYSVEAAVGQGGMGAVYRARRVEDYEQIVAIKVLRGDGIMATQLARFHRERQILAQLEHVGIARLLDGGVEQKVDRNAGVHCYLVMEYVDGTPIDRHCRKARLGFRQRLELVIDVCDAVAFAHRKLIVHRDLKPDNILVTTEGHAKLIDFGIAKLLDESGQQARLTATGRSPMTPCYASPEQILGEPVSTATDVYALGVLLYQLLTGELPGDLKNVSPPEVARRICEEAPKRPSAALAARELPGEVDIAWVRRLRGDLDAILGKALRKPPEDRYGSVAEMAADIRRHLSALPVTARRGTWRYVAGRFVRRHRAWLSVAAIAMAAFLAFLWREHRRLEVEQLRSQQLRGVLEHVILSADPDTGPLDAEKLLRRAETQISRLAHEPALRGELLDNLAWIYRKLGDSQRARRLVEQSLHSWRTLHPEDSPDLALRINNLGALLLDQADYAGAEARFREALAMRERMGQAGGPEVATNLANLGTALMLSGEWHESEAVYQRRLKLRQRTASGEPAQMAAAWRSLAALEHARGDFDAALPYAERALRLRAEAFGEDHTAVASVHDLLAQIYLGLGNFDSAEDSYLRALDTRRRRLGSDHPSVAWSELHYGHLLLRMKELPSARVLIERGYSILSQHEPPGHWRLARADTLLAGLFAARERPDLAQSCLVDAISILSRVRGQDSTYAREAELLLEEIRAGRSTELYHPPELARRPDTPDTLSKD